MPRPHVKWLLSNPCVKPLRLAERAGLHSRPTSVVAARTWNVILGRPKFHRIPVKELDRYRYEKMK